MAKFYFTYGIEGYPFYGGWTEVEAPGPASACEAFRVFHPDRLSGALNCAGVYNEDSFQKTKMYEAGNFGYHCHEKISLTREVVSK